MAVLAAYQLTGLTDSSSASSGATSVRSGQYSALLHFQPKRADIKISSVTFMIDQWSTLNVDYELVNADTNAIVASGSTTITKYQNTFNTPLAPEDRAEIKFAETVLLAGYKYIFRIKPSTGSISIKHNSGSPYNTDTQCPFVFISNGTLAAGLLIGIVYYSNPSAPTNVTVPTSVKPGETITVTFTRGVSPQGLPSIVEWDYSKTGTWITGGALTASTANMFTFTAPNDTDRLRFRVRMVEVEGKKEQSFSTVSSYISILHNVVPTIKVTSPTNAHTLYENDILSIAGNVTDTNVGDVVSIKFSINGGAARAITAVVSNGSAASFAKNLTYKAGKLFDGNTAITDTLAEGSQHSVKIWAEDDKGGKSAEITRTFYVVANRAASLTLDAFVTRTGLINTDVVNVAGNVSDLDNGNVIVRYKIGNGAFVQVLNQVVGATPTPFNFNVLVGDLADGDNQLTIQAVDAYNAITQQVLNIRKSKNEVPLLEAVTYFEITPPNGTADGLHLYVEREVGDLIVSADIFMGAPGTSETFVPMTLASTANLTNGNTEDTFAYEHSADASKIVVRINMTRASAASNKAIKKISGVLT